MKHLELRKIIREYIKKALNENTQLMSNPMVKSKVEMVIKALQEIDVDGETMQYILEKVGMEEQMQQQLTPGGIREAEYAIDFKYMKPYTQDLQQVIRSLQVLNDKIETVGPLSEDIVDALDSLEMLYDKIKQAK